MRCSKCQAENRERKKFCAQCGNPLTQRCGSCGAQNDPDDRFCGRCGAKIFISTDTEPPRLKLTIADSADIRVQSADVDSATEGERKTVTALFADIKGSTELEADLDPEEARAIVDPALNLMVEAVRRYEGFVVQPIGDGIFALFGAPFAHEDHPQRALYAAIRMQEEIRRYGDGLRAEGRAPLQIRVGANTGEVVVRTIQTGSGRVEYAPIGHTTNVAARMQTLANPGSIVISDSTQKLVDGYFALKNLGAARLRGIAEPVEMYEVTGLGPLRTKLQRAAGRGLTKFVGRQPEMGALARAADLAKSGHGQIVAAVAEPGVGKSRLFFEFKVRNQRNFAVMEAFSVSHGRANPYAPVIDLLNSYFGIETIDSPRKRREKVIGKIVALDRSLEDTMPYLYRLLMAEGDEQLADMDSTDRRRRTLDAIKRIMIRESQNQPLMVIFEDLHWIDLETQSLLNMLAESIVATPILLMVNYRPEYQHDWGSHTSYTQLRLEPLAKESAAEMLTALVGDTAEVQPLRNLIMESTGGNPFFIEETIQSLFEEGAIVRNGQVKTTKSIAHLRIPPTVQAILASRIDRLPAEEKQLLQSLAVIGKQFPLRLVREVTSQSDAVLNPILAELERREFIFEELPPDDVAYSFKHALSLEVTYNSMLIERRKVLHEHTARAMESLYAGRLDDHVNELAYHYQRSSNVTKAVEYLGRAGEQANLRSAHVETLAYLNAALSLLRKLPESNQRDRYELGMQMIVAASLMETKGDNSSDTGAAYLHAAQLSERLGDRERLFWAKTGLFLHHMVSGRYQISGGIADELLRIAGCSDDPCWPLMAHGCVAINSFWTGDLETARSHFEQAEKYFDPPRQRHLAIYIGMDPLTGLSGYAAWPLWMLGYPDHGLTKAKRTLVLARERGYASSTAMAHNHAAWSYLLRREPKIARELAETGIAMSIEQGLELWAGLCTGALGSAATQSGNHEEAVAIFERGFDGVKPTPSSPHYLNYVADSYGRIGQVAEGLRLVAESEELLRGKEESPYAPEVYRIKGELLLMQNEANAAAAEHCFRYAVEHARRHAAKSWELRATMSLVRLLMRNGRRNEARTMLAPIYNWFTEGFDTADLKDAKVLLQELST
jgi:class 3 adenylate cyclase/tetratricopeptide (TPR) repeat protein